MVLYTSLTDQQLISLLKEDNDNAFAEIYRRYAESLTSFASSKLYSLDDARDIIHDLFVKLWAERKQFTGIINLEGYLFTHARYRIVDKIRKNITREKYSAMVQSLNITYQNSIEQQIAASELKQNIEKYLAELSPRVKEIFLLSREENLSITEIAQKLQLSEQTVKNQLSVALKHLRQSLTRLSVSALILWLLQ